MSFDLGKDTSYSPPPPPRRRLSPWAVTGIGCLVLLVGAVATVSIMAVQFTNAYKAELKKPVVKEDILADLADTPLFPRVEFDEAVTRQGRAGLLAISRFIPAQKSIIGGFRTQEDARKVYAWYQEKLQAQGFHAEEGRAGRRGGHAYRKNSDMVLIQVEPEKGEWNGLVIMRFNGMRK